MTATLTATAPRQGVRKLRLPAPAPPASDRRQRAGRPAGDGCRRRPKRAFGIGDQFSITLDAAGRVDLLCSPGMTAHLRDAAYHLADDPAASETWDGAALDLLAELGDALSDALEMVRVREG